MKSRGRWFEAHGRHCVLFLSETLYILLCTGLTQEHIMTDFLTGT